MTNEQKKILLEDLCCRLPYGVKIRVEYPFLEEKDWHSEDLYGLDLKREIIAGTSIRIEEFKPYLRPMSSMTVEERKELYANFGNSEEKAIEYFEACSRWGGHNPLFTLTIGRKEKLL